MSEPQAPVDSESANNDSSSNNISGQKRARDEDDNDDAEGGRGTRTVNPSSDGDVDRPDNSDAVQTDEGKNADGDNSASLDADVDAATTTTTPASRKPPPPQSSQQASVSAASAAVASQLCASMGLQGLYSLLSLTVISGAGGGGAGSGSSGGGGAGSDAVGVGSGGGSSNSSNVLPTIEQVKQSALKSVTDNPPFCHLSKTDSAPQLKIAPDSYRLICKGGMRGYRMTRGSHGVSEGNYYYEVVILDPPSASEIAQSLPPNVRLGKKLQQDMQEALRAEERAKNAAAGIARTSGGDDANKSDANSAVSLNSDPSRSKFGAHVRLGWSMRSGDLQAPVGYDKYSYAVRDISGSKIHASRRDDNWGGEEFGPGDVVGCSISLVSGSDSTSGKKSEEEQNHIRFFKNGYPMGEFFITKGRREGGIAFAIPDGMYYPAISLYMGASVQVNFGPNFIYPPRKLPSPSGMKLQPISSVCKPPITIEEATAKVMKEKAFRKSDMQQRFLDLVKGEVDVVQDTYQKQRRKHLQDVLVERKKRNLKTDDLENDDFYDDSMDVE